MLTEPWRDQAYALVRNMGSARGQVVTLPADFAQWPGERARSYAPRVLEQVEQALTRSKEPAHTKATVKLTTETVGQVSLVGSIEDLDRVQALFAQKQWTDGLPIVVPTEARVQAMLGAVQRPPSDVVGLLAPQWGAATMERLAVNAVMAGCRPEYFPVVVAGVEAIADPAFDLLAHATCGSSTTPLFVVNGPVRKALDMSSGYGVFGAIAPANATISRALRLIRLNIGGQIPGLTSMSTFGYPGGGTGLCIAEDEEQNPWDPIHVQRGFRREDSTVTVAGILTFQNVCHQHTKQPDSLLTIIASAIANMAYRVFDQDPLDVGNVLVMLSPGYARWFAAAGYSLRDIQIALRDRARLPLGEFPQEVVPNLQKGKRINGNWVYSVAHTEQLVIFVAGGFKGSNIGSEPAIVMHTNHQDWKIVTKKISL
ncbi:MAG: hypothetical protein HYY31_06145 [Chloroflexi bacterium]|nr:hypothetical protein [Chloroflexota bacterium]